MNYSVGWVTLCFALVSDILILNFDTTIHLVGPISFHIFYFPNYSFFLGSHLNTFIILLK